MFRVNSIRYIKRQLITWKFCAKTHSQHTQKNQIQLFTYSWLSLEKSKCVFLIWCFMNERRGRSASIARFVCIWTTAVEQVSDFIGMENNTKQFLFLSIK